MNHSVGINYIFTTYLSCEIVGDHSVTVDGWLLLSSNYTVVPINVLNIFGLYN